MKQEHMNKIRKLAELETERLSIKIRSVHPQARSLLNTEIEAIQNFLIKIEEYFGFRSDGNEKTVTHVEPPVDFTGGVEPPVDTKPPVEPPEEAFHTAPTKPITLKKPRHKA